MIEAFNKIIEKYPNFSLIILGEGEKRKTLEKQIKKLNLENNVFLIGHKKNIYKYFVFLSRISRKWDKIC